MNNYDDNIRLVFDKLQTIENKVDREIHGGNGKGLWEETREIKETMHTLATSIHELSVQLSTHTGTHMGKDNAEEMSKQIRQLKYTSFGLAITVVGTILALLRLVISIGA